MLAQLCLFCLFYTIPTILFPLFTVMAPPLSPGLPTRRAFGQQYTHQASQLAEKMGRLRDKEVARREVFQKAVERILPSALLSRMGLLDGPPHCQVQVPPADTHLPAVALEDLQEGKRFFPAEQSGGKGLAEAGKEGPEPPAEEDEPSYVDPRSLELENAALKAELAHLVACEPLRATPGIQGAPSPALKESAASVGTTSVAASMLAAHHAPLLAGSPDAEAPWRHALALKDEYIEKLMAQLRDAERRCSAYEGRVHALEQQLQRQGGGGTTYTEVQELVAHVLAAAIHSSEEGV